MINLVSSLPIYIRFGILFAGLLAIMVLVDRRKLALMKEARSLVKQPGGQDSQDDGDVFTYDDGSSIDLSKYDHVPFWN